MFLTFLTNNFHPFISFLVWSCATRPMPPWSVETIPCPAFHCASGKGLCTSVSGLKVHTTHYYFCSSRKLFERKCKHVQGGCDRMERVSMRRVQLKLCCGEWGGLFFLKILTSLLTIKISFGTQKSPFWVFDPAQCVFQALQHAYLILMWHLCGEDIVWQSSRLTHLPVVCFL